MSPLAPAWSISPTDAYIPTSLRCSRILFDSIILDGRATCYRISPEQVGPIVYFNYWFRAYIKAQIHLGCTVSGPSPSNVSWTHSKRLSHWRSFSHWDQEHHVAESNGLLLALILLALSGTWLTSFWNTFPCLPETHFLLVFSCFPSYFLSVSFAGSSFLPNLEILARPSITLLSYPFLTAEDTVDSGVDKPLPMGQIQVTS